MANTTNFGWETPDDTDLVKDGAAAMRTLGNAIDTSLVDLKGGTTGQVLSKNTNTDMDFVWVTQNDADAIQNSIVDAKGDLITATAADTPARLAVGTNGQVLTADSSTATGLKWATAAAGGKVLQVISASTTTSATNTGGSMTDTNLSGTITPSSASSKVLVLIAQNYRANRTGGTFAVSYRLLRDATTLLTNDRAIVAEAVVGSSLSLIYLDSPNTTSATTYKTQHELVGGTGTSTFQENSNTSVMILMEIGA